MKPTLFTFDIFGTVLDWKTGLKNAVSSKGYAISDDDMDRIIDFQGKEESGAYKSYVEIKALSLSKILSMSKDDAEEVALNCGKWPLFPDSKQGMKELLSLAPCVATSNSDRVHANQVQNSLGQLSDWVCAEDVGAYKPSVKIWEFLSRKKKIPFNRSWWHVSAYADYDLEVARELGLTCVFVSRPHSRPGFSHYTVDSLLSLAKLIRNL